MIPFAAVRTAFLLGEWICLDCGHVEDKPDTECEKCSGLHFYPAEVVLACIDLVEENGS